MCSLRGARRLRDATGAVHRQGPCSAPGLRHHCPPRRRAAARRHPSHPRKRGREGSSGGPPGAPPPAARQRGWGRWRAPSGARRRGHVPAARRPDGSRLPPFLERGADGRDDGLGLLEDEPVLESQRPDAVRREDIVAGTILRCRRVVVMRRAVEFDRQRLGGAEEVEHMRPDRGLAPESASVDRSSPQQLPQRRLRWGERASQRTVRLEAVEPVPEPHRPGDCASRIDAGDGAGEGLRQSTSISPCVPGARTLRGSISAHRQGPCSAPGLRHLCPPRRRAAARRHPSHPRSGADGRGVGTTGSSPGRATARVGEVARAARRATEGASDPASANPSPRLARMQADAVRRGGARRARAIRWR